jgi:hypothetical protein
VYEARHQEADASHVSTDESGFGNPTVQFDWAALL